MGYVSISKIYETILCNVDVDILTSELEKGCKNNILNYLECFASDDLKKENDEIFVRQEILTKEFVANYFEKRKGDCTAKDCAHIALSRVGVPPIDDMSLESIEKTIRTLFKDMKGKVYIKRSKGKGNAFCVDYYTAEMIASNPEVIALIQKQASKAEKRNRDTVEWRAYEFEKQKIASLDRTEDSNQVLAIDERTFLMVEAIYNQFFSELDYKKYVEYRNELETLYDEWEFGERFQELYDIMHSPNYNNEFYKYMPKNDNVDGLLDVLAEKIVNKIIEKRS